jgi:prepilin-type N-terminal cleavage/methylation domain-containing protein
MKIAGAKNNSRRQAFTLIELLTVIAIIGVLSAILLPTVTAIKAAQFRKRAQTELAKMENAIKGYKDAFGFYPPVNTNNLLENQLYYELIGTTNTQTVAGQPPIFQTLDGSSTVTAADVTAAFGTGGFVNSTKPNASEDAKPARSFLTDLKPGQSADVSVNGRTVKLLVCTVEGPLNSTGVNPFRYNSANPTNNPGSFDLWVDIMVRGKSNRISNWSSQPQIVR